MNLPDAQSVQKEKVLVLGAGGHDGPFLCKILSENFDVVAYSRNRSERLLSTKVSIIDGEVSELSALRKMIFDVKPNYVVNLVSLSSVFECQVNPELSSEVNYDFVVKLFNVLSEYSNVARVRPTLLQASSSEIYGNSDTECNEFTPLRPVSQYGYDKARAHEYLENNESGEIEIKRAILFNHESEYRRKNFVSQKIAIAAANFKQGLEYELTLGNVGAARDWGYAPDYMQALSQMLVNPGHETFIVASGKLHSIEQMIRAAFEVEVEFDCSSLYTVDTNLIRKKETGALVGSGEKIEKVLGWKPEVTFPEMMKIMVDFQISAMKKE
jgi:GDPmannose 4,6-dehydratase